MSGGKKYLGFMENLYEVFHESSEKTAMPVKCHLLSFCGFLHRVRRQLKTEVFNCLFVTNFYDFSLNSHSLARKLLSLSLSLSL